jgi:S1-C subfamily serine protease
MSVFMRIISALFFSFCAITIFAQENVQWKSIIYDKFDDNAYEWQLNNDIFRKAEVANGALVDESTSKGKMLINKIEANLDANKDYIIKFSIANANNNLGERHEVFEKNKDGEVRSKTVGKSTWGFTWGFKDWDNYNAIVFKREPKGEVTGFEVFTKTNGKTKHHMEWKNFGAYGIKNLSETNTIALYKTENEINIYSETESTPSYIATIVNPNWFGNGVGPLIGSGAKVKLDFVTVREKKEHPVTDWTSEKLKQYWVDNGIDNIEGIYESTSNSINSPKYTLALKKGEEKYTLIYLDGGKEGNWKEGDVKAYLSKTGTPMLFKVEYFMADRSLEEDLYIGFEKGAMKIIWTNRNENIYIKLFPTLDDDLKVSRDSKSSGTGFAIAARGYIATNYHVVSGSDNISVRGIDGDFGTTYKAKVVLEDKNNDLAVIKIDDDKFKTFQNIPYTMKRGVEDVGSSVYALGYPLRATMGDEVKLTNGIISSKTGYKGDITTYQISVPIQPGNSGGPMFDEDGNIVGIINAKHLGADNVSYAIKTNYLYNLLEILDKMPNTPTENTLKDKKLSEQVKGLKEFVFIVEVN